MTFSSFAKLSVALEGSYSGDYKPFPLSTLLGEVVVLVNNEAVGLPLKKLSDEEKYFYDMWLSEVPPTANCMSIFTKEGSGRDALCDKPALTHLILLLFLEKVQGIMPC